MSLGMITVPGLGNIAYTGASRQDMSLLGAFGADVPDPNVKALQESLIKLTVYVPTANPGAATGILDATTIQAVAAVIPTLTRYLSKDVATVIQFALLGAGLSETAMNKAKPYVKQYARVIKTAVDALYIEKSSKPPAPGTTSTPYYQPQTYATKPWYTTGVGIAALAVGSLLLLGGLYVAVK